MCRKKIFFFIFFLFIYSGVVSQEEEVYNVKILKAKIIDTLEGKDVLVLLYVTSKKKKDWSPVLSMRVTYSFDDDTLQTIDIMKTNKIGIIVYGKSIELKDKQNYDLIKDKIDVNVPEDFWILAFNFRKITAKPIKKMTFIYGFWEKRHQNRRLEKEYKFDIE